MDKPIIINGVDVSGCEFYCEYDLSCREINGKYDTDICDFDKCENKICYFKNLKRKEQENIKYKKIINKIKNLCAEHPFCDCSCGQDILNVMENVNEVENEE